MVTPILLAIACMHHVQLESTPVGADVYLGEEHIGNTPMTMTMWWFPGRKLPVELRLNGYRNLPVRLDRGISTQGVLVELLLFRYRTLLGREVRSTHRFQLIREHGPAGTWSPNDAKRMK